MGRKKRANPSTEFNNAAHQNIGANNSNSNNNNAYQFDNSNKKSKSGEKEESYPVKKYRSSTYYASIEAFSKYTKAHRMLDAAYVRVPIPNAPAQLEKPFLFSTRVGGQSLAWGRGKTRDAAIDCACRAAFSLVQAHGYEDFTLDDDCFMNMPSSLTLTSDGNPPPPPPPPPPLPPMGLGVIPPTGFPPGVMPPTVQPGNVSLIPQPTIPLSTDAPIASSLSSSNHFSSDPNAMTTASITPSLSLSISDKKSAQDNQQNVVTTKGGLRLVFIPDVITSDVNEKAETCMEERRALQPRYQMMLHKAVMNRRMAATAAAVTTHNDDLM